MPKQVDHPDVRARLGAAVVPLFVEQGYAAVSMQALANAAGVTKSTAYHYFPTKAAWFGAACAAALGDEVIALRAAAGGGTPLERLRRILQTVGAGPELRLRTLVLLEAVRGGAGPAIAPAIADYAAQVAELLGVPLAAAHRLLAAMTGAALLQEIDPTVEVSGLYERALEGE